MVKGANVEVWKNAFCETHNQLTRDDRRAVLRFVTGVRDVQRQMREGRTYDFWDRKNRNIYYEALLNSGDDFVHLFAAVEKYCLPLSGKSVGRAVQKLKDMHYQDAYLLMALS